MKSRRKVRLSNSRKSDRPVRCCVLIPSRGRPQTLGRMLSAMPFLLEYNLMVGVENDERMEYRLNIDSRIRNDVTLITYNNPEGSVALARERLRCAAINAEYDWYVMTDDNARFTEQALRALVYSADAYQKQTGILTFMAGMHSTAKHFDRHHIARGVETVGGYASYWAPGFIFHAVPHAWYAQYSYPGGCFALEDRHMMFAAIRAGHREFRVCMDAPFSKKRYEPGGQGDLEKRRWNCGRAIEQLAHDFPEYMGVKGVWSTPWQAIFQYADGLVDLERLPGGAMRTSEALIKKRRV